MWHTPEEAEQAFYQAFEARDLEAMGRVWEDSDEVVCVHPMGERQHGRAAVLAGWKALFESGVRLNFTVRDGLGYGAGDVTARVVHEDIHTDEEPPRLARMVATNVFRAGAGGWRLVAHHASPLPQPADAMESVVLH